MTQRKLALRKETLTELSSAELVAVVGGASGPSCTACGSDFQQCVTGRGCVPTLDTCVATLQSC